MDLYYKQEVTVGLLVIVAGAILFAGLAWLTGTNLGRSGVVTVPVGFADVNGLQAGDPVQVSGYRVGRVADMVLEEVGRVVVYLEVSEDVRPRIDASARVAALDFLGAKYVDYQPGRSSQLLADGQMVTGSRESDLLGGAGGIANQASEVLTGLQGMLTDDMAGELRATMGAARQAMEVMARVGDGPMVNEATDALRHMGSAAQRLDSTLANPSIDESLNQLDELTLSLREMADGLAGATNAMSSILEKMDAGEGSFGKAVNDTTLHNDLHEVLLSMRRLLDDMRERPGRYFRLKVF